MDHSFILLCFLTTTLYFYVISYPDYFSYFSGSMSADIIKAFDVRDELTIDYHVFRILRVQPRQ